MDNFAVSPEGYHGVASLVVRPLKSVPVGTLREIRGLMMLQTH